MNTKYSAIALAVLGFNASAQDSQKFKQLMAMDLGEMLKVEVATGTAKQLSEAPAVVSVVTAEDIRAMGARTLSEAIERVPGLHVSTSIIRAADTFSIRGVQSDVTPQVLVLIDGVEISELANYANPYSFRYPVNAIERIEIIRGPGSAIYGADAFSGVINIITKTSDDDSKSEAGVSFGDFDYKEAWLNANFSAEKLKINMSVTREEQGNDDDRITPYGVMERSRELTNIHLNLTYGDFSLKNWYWDSEQFLGIGAGIIANNIDRDDSRAWRTQLSWNGTLQENLVGSFDASYSENQFDALFQLFPPGVWPIGPDGNFGIPPVAPVSFPEGIIGQPQGNTIKTRLNAAMIYSGYENHRLRVGFGFENSELTDIREFKNFGPGVLDTANLPPVGELGFPVSNTIVDVTGTPFIYTPDYDRELWYVSFQDEWKVAENWEITAGVRYDDYSDFGSTTNPRLAVVWTTTETFTSKLLFGTAFRAPRVAELAFINNPTVLGNPQVEPEKIDTIEMAFDYRPNNRFNGSLNIFKYQSEDLIQLDQTFTYQNIGEQDGYGIEVEANWQATDKLRVNANFSWLNSEVVLPPSVDGTSNNEDKALVPGTMAHLDIRYQISPEWLFSMQNYWIGDRERQSGDARDEIDDYLKTDATLIWQPATEWNVRLGIKNLFNDDIRQPSPNSALFAAGLGFPGDIPMESQNFYGSLIYTF